MFTTSHRTPASGLGVRGVRLYFRYWPFWWLPIPLERLPAIAYCFSK